jgi:predicted DsbA family dithiol-disulfide isomerase
LRAWTEGCGRRVHPHAESAAEAAEAAGSQRMFWQIHGTLFAADAPLTNGLLTAAAAAIGVNVPSFQEDLKPHVNLPRVREDFLTGVRSGVNGPPAFYMAPALLPRAETLAGRT